MNETQQLLNAIRQVEQGIRTLNYLMTFEALPLQVCSPRHGGSLEKVKAYVAGRALTTPSAPTPFCFGVEIECFCRVNDLLNSEGEQIRSENYNHVDGKSWFKCITDGSLLPTPETGGLTAREIVSPKLSANGGFERLRSVCDQLNAAGAKVNKTCGLHVHIDATDLTFDEYRAVVVNYYYLQPIISASLAPSRRQNKYCNPLTPEYIEMLQSLVCFDDLRMCGCSRYFAVNVRAYSAHSTIEFRQHQGTTNYAKIRNWVEFCASLVEWSKTTRLGETVYDRTSPLLQGLAINKLKIRND